MTTRSSFKGDDGSVSEQKVDKKQAFVHRQTRIIEGKKCIFRNGQVFECLFKSLT